MSNVHTPRLDNSAKQQKVQALQQRRGAAPWSPPARRLPVGKDPWRRRSR